MLTWDQIYNFFGIREFVYFISSPAIQDTLFPIKLVFMVFTAFLFFAVIYFYINSSYIQYQFLQDVVEFFSVGTYGLGKVTKSWKKIKRRADIGSEQELKLAILEADDFLYETLQDAGYDGSTFEELVEQAAKKNLPNADEILENHQIRNSILYDNNYTLNAESAKKILSAYETAIKTSAIA